MTTTHLYDSYRDYWTIPPTPEWHASAVEYLRGNYDKGHYGLYLYQRIRETPDIRCVLDIGTARGYSAACIAAGLHGRNGGVVHTVDVNDPDESRSWANGKLPASDPIAGEERTVTSIVEESMPGEIADVIQYHGDTSTNYLKAYSGPAFDLVFHDGAHHYDPLRRDIDLVHELNPDAIQVCDDTYLYHQRGESWLAEYPVIGERCKPYRLTKHRFPGVARAVSEAIQAYDWSDVTIINDPDHSPLAALTP